jgi:Carbohydrate esterase, sialic acid-specific acetylesterase
MRSVQTSSCSQSVRRSPLASALVALLIAACAEPTQVLEPPPVEVEETTQGPGYASATLSVEPEIPKAVDDGCDSLPMFLLAGQSNMEGNVNTELFTSLLAELGKGSDDDLQERLLAALNYWYFEVDDGYASYGWSDEMADLQTAELIAYRDQGLMGADLTAPHADTYCSFNDTPVDRLAVNCGYPFGPELMLGHARAAAGHRPTSLVKVARGGSTLFTDWLSPSSGGEVGADYVLLQERIASFAKSPAGVHPACAAEECHWGAFIWFQGENDSFEQSHAATYESNLRNLLADVRAEVGDPELPVIIVQTGSWAQSLYFGRQVAEAQQRIDYEDANAELVVTDDLSGFYHYDPAAQLIIGKRIADVLETMLECD